MADDKSRVVVIIVFDGVKLLDAAGPAEVFAEANRFGANYSLQIASVDGCDVTTTIGTRFAVTDRISEIDSADTVVVAGGDVLVGQPIDPALVEALKTVPARTRRLASVCTGSFILAQAGLLNGRRATTHWAYTGLLPMVGATYEKARVVRDGNVFTGGGVTAGIDFALTLAAEVAGPELAQRIQLSIEYDPAPPFSAGHPDHAPAAVREGLAERYESRLATFRGELQEAMSRA